MTLKKIEFVEVGDWVVEYHLSNYFCPKCGNQTMYYLGSQIVAYICVNCHAELQIRPDTKPICANEVLFEQVKLEAEEELLPHWSDV